MSSENSQNLESKEYVKANPIEILLRVQNTNVYVPKELKQIKKKNP